MADTPARQMTPAQRAYEEKRAKKAGMSLEKWLTLKDKGPAAGGAKPPKTAEAAKPPPKKKPNFLQRLLEKAEKPLK
ncbi:MAG: hypothetical protein ACK4PG_00380 [Acetobacteraceae bacterium]